MATSNDPLPNIGAVISHYGGNVYRTSGQGAVRCPFHDDKHASAGIDFNNQLFNCFTCGVKGNSLQIIAQREGVNIGKAALIAEGITGESHVKLRGEYSSGSRLPAKKRHNSADSTAGAIRRSRAS